MCVALCPLLCPFLCKLVFVFVFSFLAYVQVHIYPLRIHFTEQIFRMVWVYLFPPENDDDLRLNVRGPYTLLGPRSCEPKLGIIQYCDCLACMVSVYLLSLEYEDIFRLNVKGAYALLHPSPTKNCNLLYSSVLYTEL